MSNFNSPPREESHMENSKLNDYIVINYLLTHPEFLENFVTGPQISKETFQNWTLKRNTNKLRRNSRRNLLNSYSVKIFF